MLRNHSMHVYVPFCLFVLQPSSVQQACLSGTGRRACQCQAQPSPAGARLPARPGDAHSSGGAPRPAPTWAPPVNPGTACHVTETLARRDDPTAPPPPTSATPPLQYSTPHHLRLCFAIRRRYRCTVRPWPQLSCRRNSHRFLASCCWRSLPGRGVLDYERRNCYHSKAPPLFGSVPVFHRFPPSAS